MGRDKRNENKQEAVTALRLSVMRTPAWRALSPTAQALYPWLKLEWRGAKFNNNGKLRLSTRQAAERMGCAINTAMRGFHDLQAKGFIIQTEGACLGTEGMGKSPAYELTEIMPAGQQGPGKQWFLNWSEGHDFPVKVAATPARAKTKPRRKFEDSTVVILETKR
ncbi:hypothetical protein [Celeribacter persicus]|uniref:Helix-turn-helix protein n=1 Tax=Celeribacter persicus TaxID=1651082 RepID=A0A2T5HMG1_9RHOB|nr:hypothetical protein [Celeribacter persicus]PTQ72742.1 hypothetical protein C8N42_106254 [Celeribacter persicus]